MADYPNENSLLDESNPKLPKYEDHKDVSAAPDDNAIEENDILVKVKKFENTESSLFNFLSVGFPGRKSTIGVQF